MRHENGGKSGKASESSGGNEESNAQNGEGGVALAAGVIMAWRRVGVSAISIEKKKKWRPAWYGGGGIEAGGGGNI
jgi:hypothetical protein